MAGVRIYLLEGEVTPSFLPALLPALKYPKEVLSAVICSSTVQTFTPVATHAAALAASS